MMNREAPTGDARGAIHDPWSMPRAVPAALLEWDPQYRPHPPGFIAPPRPDPEFGPGGVWQPTALGSGLVHDWGLSIGAHGLPGVLPAPPGSMFFQHPAWSAKGFHAVHLHSYRETNSAPRLATIWQQDDDSSFQFLALDNLNRVAAEGFIADMRMRDDGWRVVSVAAVETSPFVITYALSLIRDGRFPAQQWGVRLDAGFAQLQADIAAFAPLRKRIVSLAATASQAAFGAPRFSYVWVQESGSDRLTWKVELLGLPAAPLAISNFIKNQLAAGWMPVCLDSYFVDDGETGALVALLAEDRSGLGAAGWSAPPPTSLAADFAAAHQLRKLQFPEKQLVAYTTVRASVGSSLRGFAVWRDPLPRSADVDRSAPSKLSATRTAAFEDAILGLMKAADIPHAALAVARKGEVVLNRAFTWGPRGLRTTQLSSVFRVASASKAITALGVMKALQDRAKSEVPPAQFAARLDELLDSRFFLDFPGMPSIAGFDGSPEENTYIANTTVRMMLQHRGAWAGRLAIQDIGTTLKQHQKALAQIGIKPPFPALDRSALVRYLLDSKFWTNDESALLSHGYDFSNITPSQGRYSNVGYTLLELLIEALSGEPFESYIQSRILEPAGAFSTRLKSDVRFESAPRDVTLSANGRYLGDFLPGSGTSVVPSVLGWNAASSAFPTSPYGSDLVTGVYAGGGGWASTVNDMLNILKAFDKFKFKPGPDDETIGMLNLEGESILDHATVLAMWNKDPLVTANGLPYALGWVHTKDDDAFDDDKLPGQFDPDLRWHTGNWHGAYSAFAWQSERRQFAFAFSRQRTSATNSAHPDDEELNVTAIFSTVAKLVRKLP